MKRIAATLFMLFQSSLCFAQQPAAWKLPLDLNDENTSVRFDVDTTWHMVTGHISGTTGTVGLQDPGDISSIVADIHFPVKKFDTGWGMRDSSLYDHMAAEKFPEVRIQTSALKGNCTPELASAGGCSGMLEGQLTIRDVSKNVSLPVKITKKGSNYLVSGKYTLRWAEYNVEDPSIMVASVKPEVTISYSVTVPAGEN